MREARLRPEFAHIYPELVPGQWEPAARIARVILARYLVQQMADAASPDRALDETHFEFRGGAEPSRVNLRERNEDRESPAGGS
jgi:hypothetical protein